MHTLFETHRRTLAQTLLFVLSGLFIICSPTDALASRVVWKSTTIKERTKNESWYLEMEIHLNSPPAVGTKAMKFEFTQTAEFERSLEDGHEEPVERTIPLTNQQSIIESQLVGFMDPGTGQIQSRTRFSFKVTRAHGYRAGKWTVKIKDADTGALIGSPTTLTLLGENPVVDRRSMVFQPSGRKTKEEKAENPEPTETSDASDEAVSEADGDTAPEPTDAGQEPPSIEEKPGGGCHHGGAHHRADWTWLSVGLFFAGLFWVRRRQI